MAEARKTEYETTTNNFDFAVDDYKFKGPLGSRSKQLPTNVGELHRELNQPRPTVMASRGLPKLRKWTSAMGASKKDVRTFYTRLRHILLYDDMLFYRKRKDFDFILHIYSSLQYQHRSQSEIFTD